MTATLQNRLREVDLLHSGHEDWHIGNGSCTLSVEVTMEVFVCDERERTQSVASPIVPVAPCITA